MLKHRSITGKDGKLLRVSEAAALLGLTPRTIRSWLLQRRIPCVRLSARAIRLRKSDVDEIIERGLVGAA
jgi:excisionase family DNA binding protein